MNASLMLALAAPIVFVASQPLNAQEIQSDTRYVTCGVRYPNSQPKAQYTPIAKVTKPFRAGNSNPPNTVHIIGAAWRSLLIANGVKFHESYCLSGDTITQTQKLVMNYELRIGYTKMERDEIAFDKSWPKLIDRVFAEDRVIMRAVTRNQYAAEPAGSVGPAMGKTAFSI